MTDRKWLDGYSGQSTEELISLADEYRTDSVVLAFEEALQRKASRLGTSALTNEERVILAVEALEREVNNGGYSQFFVNSSREYAPMIVDALQRIGCPAAANLTQDALDALGLSGPASAEAIGHLMDQGSHAIEAVLDTCDQRYFKLVGDLSGPLLEFIRGNKQNVSLGDHV